MESRAWYQNSFNINAKFHHDFSQMILPLGKCLAGMSSTEPGMWRVFPPHICLPLVQPLHPNLTSSPRKPWETTISPPLLFSAAHLPLCNFFFFFFLSHEGIVIFHAQKFFSPRYFFKQRSISTTIWK